MKSCAKRGAGVYVYQYNGKELNEDLGLDWYNYGFRMYDPAIGRFPSVDPISEQFPWVSGFNYAENEPIANIDLHGLQKLRATISGSINQGVVGAELKALGLREGYSANIGKYDLLGVSVSYDSSEGLSGDVTYLDDNTLTTGGGGGILFVGGSANVTLNTENTDKKVTVEGNYGIFYSKIISIIKSDGSIENENSYGIQLGANGGAGILGGEINASLEVVVPGKTKLPLEGNSDAELIAPQDATSVRPVVPLDLNDIIKEN